MTTEPYWPTPFVFDRLEDRILTVDGKVVAVVFVGVEHTEEQIAMGYKLAAAPDLLAVLEAVMLGVWYNDPAGERPLQVTMTRGTEQEVRSAIAKARGAS